MLDILTKHLEEKASINCVVSVWIESLEDAEKEEKWLHSIFADRRARDSREFFKMNPEYAALALKRVELKEAKIESDLTPEQEKEVDEFKETIEALYAF